MISRLLVIIMLCIATCYLVAWMDKNDYFTKISKFFFKQTKNKKGK